MNSISPKIYLKPVTKENYLDCIQLEMLPEQQKNLASNAVTIAQSKFEIHYQLRAIYLDNKVIGMLAFCHEDEPVDLTHFWLFRMMIAQEYQNQGYAQIVGKVVIDELKPLGAKRIDSMCKPNNLQSLSALKKFGFKEIGFLDDGDIHLTLNLD